MQISHNDQEFFGAFLINHASAIVEHSSADLFPGLQPLLLRRLKLVKEPNKQIFHTQKSIRAPKVVRLFCGQKEQYWVSWQLDTKTLWLGLTYRGRGKGREGLAIKCLEILPGRATSYHTTDLNEELL